MTLNDFQAKLKAITKDSKDIYTSPDFQCDQTGGFPASLCVCWEKGKAWLQLNESMIMMVRMSRSMNSTAPILDFGAVMTPMTLTDF